jgi:DNA-binding response OmpR family regulator
LDRTGEVYRNSRILIVEDERHIARYLEFVLRKEGYEVVIANDGEAALDRMAAFDPGAVLLDLVLPGMSGMEVLQAIRSNPRFAGLVVIVLSARSSEEDTEALAAAHVQAQCPKPVAPSTLLRKLSEFGIRPGIAA